MLSNQQDSLELHIFPCGKRKPERSVTIFLSANARIAFRKISPVPDHFQVGREIADFCRAGEREKGAAHQNVFTPGETNCACTILLNLSTTLPRLHSLMSFRSGGPGQGRNEVWTDERGRVCSSKRDEGGWSVSVWFLLEFAYFSRWFNFYGPQNRTSRLLLLCARSLFSTFLHRDAAVSG